MISRIVGDVQESPTIATLVEERRSPAPQGLAVALACVSLSLWFWLTFPWQHHNESLTWAVNLDNMSFWQTLTSNPIPSVQNFRPLGVATAWITYHLSGGGIWLQQIVNFALTALAWALACTACRRQLTFAWLSFICGVAFFSGYIYLFHLHGVFYPPLLVFVAALLVQQSRMPALQWRSALVGLAGAALVGAFHPFALLIFAVYMAGLWVECRIDRRPAPLGAAVITGGAALLLAATLVLSASGLGAGDPLQGLVTSYQMLEVNRIVTFISVLLAVVAGISLGVTRRMRLAAGGAAGIGALVLMLIGLPVIFCFITVCLMNALRNRRVALAALIVACAVIPVATGSGSPTYALFVVMPCIAAIADDLPLPGSQQQQRGLAAAAVLATLGLLVGLRAGIALPVVGDAILPLRAEQEKTRQLMSAFAWLDQQPELAGRLELCSAATDPAEGDSALDRTFRAPTHASNLEEYAGARFGSRMTSGAPLRLCFGGQASSGAEVLYSIPGQWAGTASIQRPVDRTGTTRRTAESPG